MYTKYWELTRRNEEDCECRSTYRLQTYESIPRAGTPLDALRNLNKQELETSLSICMVDPSNHTSLMAYAADTHNDVRLPIWFPISHAAGDGRNAPETSTGATFLYLDRSVEERNKSRHRSVRRPLFRIIRHPIRHYKHPWLPRIRAPPESSLKRIALGRHLRLRTRYSV
jgi:hypothetical protein